MNDIRLIASVGGQWIIGEQADDEWHDDGITLRHPHLIAVGPNSQVALVPYGIFAKEDAILFDRVLHNLTPKDELRRVYLESIGEKTIIVPKARIQ